MHPLRRSFVSTVLLSWDARSLVELRSEASARGLSTKGNKSALVARIREHDRTAARVTTQAASPGIPLAVRPAAAPAADFLATRLPDLAPPLPAPPVQVPYVPDFWNSARPKTVPSPEPEPPKLHVVSSSATYYGPGPVHILEEADFPSASVHAPAPPTSNPVGFWADLWQALGLPRSFSPRRTLSDLSAQAERDTSQPRSRPLTDEERKGLYVLLAIVGGSWLAAGLVNRPSTVVEERGTQSHH